MKKTITREKILEAALKAFSKKGYIGSTTKEIAGDAEVAEVTLFRHFPSKEKLFEEVITTSSFLPALKGLLPELRSLTYEEALTVIGTRFLENLYARKDLIRIMHSEVHRYPEKISGIYQAFIDETFHTLASYFSEMQKKRLLTAFNAELGARAFLGMFFAYFNAQEILMHKKHRPADSVGIVKEYVGIFARGTLI